MDTEFNKYNKLQQNYLTDYTREYGERSTWKIINTIKNSKHTANLLNQSSTGRFVPNVGDFNSFVLSNLSLSFARTSKIRFASIILLNYWHNDVNISLNIASEEEVTYLFNKIINTTT
jgi:hypothetical protein